MSKETSDLIDLLSSKRYSANHNALSVKGEIGNMCDQNAFRQGCRDFLPEYNKMIISRLESAMAGIKQEKASYPNSEVWVYQCRDVESVIYGLIKELKK